MYGKMFEQAIKKYYQVQFVDGPCQLKSTIIPQLTNVLSEFEKSVVAFWVLSGWGTSYCGTQKIAVKMLCIVSKCFYFFGWLLLTKLRV